MGDVNLKKRPLEHVSHGSRVHKPFRSPLKTTPPNALTHSPVNTPHHQAHAAPLLRHKPHSQPGTPSTPAAPHATLQLSTLRNQISALSQSLKIRASPRNSELESLILKWRSAARAAAEVLFDSAREKVRDSGGMRGMRAREEEREKRHQAWEEEAREEEQRKADEALQSSEGEDDEDEEDQDTGSGNVRLSRKEQRETRNEAKRDMRAAIQTRREEASSAGAEEWESAEREDRNQKNVWAAEEDEDSFTIDIMLRAMNVDLNVIGYDTVHQKWAD